MGLYKKVDLRCKKCTGEAAKKVWQSASALESHQRSHDPPSVPCAVCQTDPNASKEMKGKLYKPESIPSHVSNVHNATLVCDVCTEKNGGVSTGKHYSATSLASHIASVHAPATVLCDVCKTDFGLDLFFNEYKLAKHIKYWHDPVTLPCDECTRQNNNEPTGERFSRARLNVHMQVHKAGKGAKGRHDDGSGVQTRERFQCPVCAKIRSSRAAYYSCLKGHLNDAEDE